MSKSLFDIINKTRKFWIVIGDGEPERTQDDCANELCKIDDLECNSIPIEPWVKDWILRLYRRLLLFTEKMEHCEGRIKERIKKDPDFIHKVIDPYFARFGLRWDLWEAKKRRWGITSDDIPLDIGDDGEEIYEVKGGPLTIRKLWKDNYRIRFSGEKVCAEWRVLPKDVKVAEDKVALEFLKSRDKQDDSFFFLLDIPWYRLIEAVEERIENEGIRECLEQTGKRIVQEMVERMYWKQEIEIERPMRESKSFAISYWGIKR